jgi:hypothetical protein
MAPGPLYEIESNPFTQRGFIGDSGSDIIMKAAVRASRVYALRASGFEYVGRFGVESFGIEMDVYYCTDEQWRYCFIDGKIGWGDSQVAGHPRGWRLRDIAAKCCGVRLGIASSWSLGGDGLARASRRDTTQCS